MGTSHEHPRRFLFVQSTTEQGGAETVLLNALAASAGLRDESIVATLGFGEGDLPERLKAFGVEVLQLPPTRLRHPLGVMRTVRTLARIARERDIRVTVGNGAHPQVFAALAARLAGIKTAYLVNMIHEARPLANPLIDLVAIRGPMDVALSNSRASMEPMRRLRPRVRHELVYPGTPITRVDTARLVAARRELGGGPGEILFGLFGRLQRSKGQDVFLRAGARIAQELPQARLAVVGGSVFGLEPEYAEELRRLAASLGLTERARFLGHRKDVSLLMAACDVICHATRATEGFGMVIIEAMVQGRPVVATRTGGPSEIIEDGETGLLVSPDHPEELAEAMLRLGRDEGLRSGMGERARATAAERFSAEAFGRRLHEQLTAVSSASDA